MTRLFLFKYFNNIYETVCAYIFIKIVKNVVDVFKSPFLIAGKLIDFLNNHLMKEIIKYNF